MLKIQRYGILLALTLLVVIFTPERVNARTSPMPLTSTSTDEGVLTYAGEVFHDGNLNGIYEPSEKEIPGILVTLETLEGTVIQEATSEVDGSYVFTNMPKGQFRVRVWPPHGYSVTENGTYTINTHEPQATAIRSTGLFLGVFLPTVQR